MVWRYRQKHNINVSITMLFFSANSFNLPRRVFVRSPPFNAFTKLALISSDKQTLELKIQLMRGVWKWLCCAAAAERERGAQQRKIQGIQWFHENELNGISNRRIVLTPSRCCLSRWNFKRAERIHTRTIRKWDMSVPYILKACWIEKELWTWVNNPQNAFHPLLRCERSKSFDVNCLQIASWSWRWH